MNAIISLKSLKMIVTDLDNTLLRNDKSLSEYSKNIIQKFKKSGIPIIFATARPERGAQNIGIIPDGIISNNGALVRYDDKIIYNKSISFSVRKKLIEELINTKEIKGITAEDNNFLHTNCYKEEFEKLADFWRPKFTDFNKIPDTAIYKIAIHTKNQKLLNEIIKKYNECHIESSSGEDWHILTHRDATKMNAINALTNFLDIEIKNIIAFGDDNNDLEMIKNCGVGVAVSNAIDNVRKVADFITKSNNKDGVAKFLDNLLKKMGT
ncbi:MAG: HAD family hydrolase [Candidatus Woesearchaeota archaeon]